MLVACPLLLLRRLVFGDLEAARRLVQESGPFSHVVGSDLLQPGRFSLSWHVVWSNTELF